MATKNHVDSSVAERRLRPIYNWLDDGNNKKALQEAEKVLKKQPHFQCAKVLKGLALLRLGKENDCQELLETVRQDLQSDDSTLQAMTICYRELNKPEIICDVYSDAAKKDPKNEELLTHLFMAYVRVCDYKKQQQTAMTLYKLKFKNHYYFWTVMSIVMQAHEAGPELANSLQLPLAEKMVKKFVDDGKIEAEQEVQLYLLILEMQNKLEEALNVVEGPLGEMLHSFIVVPSKRVELLVKMEYWRRANIEIKKLLMEDMDNWSLYVDYLKSVFNVVNLQHNGNDVFSDDSCDSCINDSVKFLKNIQNKNQSGCHRFRGPYLAVMEFFVQLKNNGIDPEVHLGSFTDLLLEYFRNFGSKTCCLSDLKPYLNVLDESQVTTFLDEIWKFIELEDGQLPTSKEQMLKYISNLHITRYLGFHEKLNVAAKTQLADCLLKYFIHGAQFNGSSLLPTDIRHNDPFVVLIVEILNDIWLETTDANYLRNAIIILEYALDRSPSNHQFKIFLIKFYNTLGISKGSHRIYDMLDIKHVQLDSMGYLQCWSLISTGLYFLASHLCDITLKFFTSNYKDSADHLTFLYKFGSFLKINEFIKFREQINNSFHYSAVTVEKMLLDLLHSASHINTIQVVEQMCIDPVKESIQFNKLDDNRDLDLCWTSDPSNRQLSQEIIKVSFEHEVEFLRVRSLLLRNLAGAVQFATSSSNSVENGNEENPDAKEPQKVIKNINQQLMHFKKSLLENKYTKLPKNVINKPPDSRLFYFLELPYLNLLEALNRMLLAIIEDDFEIKNKIDPEKNPLSKLSEAISAFSTECKSSDHTQLGIRCRLLNLLTLLVEMVSISCLFCGASHKVITPHSSHQVKKSKKKKNLMLSDQVNESGAKKKTCIDTVQNLIALTSLALQDLDSCVSFIEDKWREPESSDKEIYNLMELLSLEEINSTNMYGINKLVLDSYQSSLSEIRNVLRVKNKYLSELKL